MKNQTLTKMNDENNLSSNGNIKQTTNTIRTRDMLEHKDKYQYLEYEVSVIPILGENHFYCFFSFNVMKLMLIVYGDISNNYNWIVR